MIYKQTPILYMAIEMTYIDNEWVVFPCENKFLTVLLYKRAMFKYLYS